MTVAEPKKRRSRGMTLVEVVIALAILAMAFFGMVSVITYTSRMNASTRERMIAMRAAERKIEQMLACTNFDDIFNTFSAQTEGNGWETIYDIDSAGQPHEAFKAVDPDVAQRTTATGYVYPRLPLMPEDYNKRAHLFVRFPLNAGGTGLSEVGAGTFMEMADANLDLNKSGVAGDSSNLVVADCSLLPVSVEVYWRGIVGPTAGNRGNNSLKYRYIFLRKAT